MPKERLDALHQAVSETRATLFGKEIPWEEGIAEAISLLQILKEREGRTFVIGNGGSAGIASHFSVDLINVLKIRAMTLVDSNVMTCMANDFGYEQVYSRPLHVLLEPKDLLVAISSSGASRNILQAVAVAQEKEATVLTLSGFSEGNPLREKGALNFWLPRSDYGLVEMGHFFLLHTVVDRWCAVEEVDCHARKN